MLVLFIFDGFFVFFLGRGVELGVVVEIRVLVILGRVGFLFLVLLGYFL